MAPYPMAETACWPILRVGKGKGLVCNEGYEPLHAGYMLWVPPVRQNTPEC